MSIKVLNDYVDFEDSCVIENFNKLMEDAVANSPIESTNAVIKGVVREIDKKKGLVCVDVSLKSEGFINIEQFFLENEKENLKVGDVVEVYIRNIDTTDRRIDISREDAIAEYSWREIVKAKNDDAPVSGIAFSRVKGGISVDFKGVIAFLPGSQIDIRPVRDISNIVGKPLSYKVLNFTDVTKRVKRSVIVSRKAILEFERSDERDGFLSNIQEGSVVDGIVKNITHYGAFVDLGAVDGLLHVTDIVWEKISHPSEVLKVGDSVKVKVIKYDKAEKRLSLGMKQLTDNPWFSIVEKYKVGTVVTGKIVNIATYGAFVQIENGIEGLLHVSEISWGKDSYKKHKEMEVGQEVSAVVLEIDVDRHRIALSMRQVSENPWERFARTYNVGQILDGIVRNVTDFGLFIGIDGVEVDGLVHTSDLSWTENVAQEIAKYQKGDKVKVLYLGSDLVNQRIKFGIKQLSEDPMSPHLDSIKVGSVVTCKVVEIRPDGIEVELFDSIRAFIKKSNLARERVEQRADKFVVGDRVDAKVIQYSSDVRKIVLSIKDYEDDEHLKTLEKYGSVNTGATIGDVLGGAIKTATSKASSTEKTDSETDDVEKE